MQVLLYLLIFVVAVASYSYRNRWHKFSGYLFMLTLCRTEIVYYKGRFYLYRTRLPTHRPQRYFWRHTLFTIIMQYPSTGGVPKIYPMCLAFLNF